MPIFNGSLVDELLNELSSRLAAAPELIETYDLEDVRFQLSVLVADKLSSDRRRDLDLQGAAPQDDEDEAADLEGAGYADALEQCGDHALEGESGTNSLLLRGALAGVARALAGD